MTDLRVVGGDLLPPAARTPPPALDRRPHARRRRAPARDRALVRALAGARQEEAADAPRPAHPQPLLRVVDADVVVVRARREAPLGRHADVKSVGSSVDKGESLKDTALTLSAYDPDVIVVRHPEVGAARVRRAADRRARRERGRRQAPASDPGAARPLHDARGVRPARRAARRDRRRRRCTRASPARSSRRCGSSAPTRSSSARRRSLPERARADLARHRVDRRRRRRLRAPHAARADARRRELRAVARASTPRAGGSRPSASRDGQRVMHPGPMNRGVEIDARVADSRRRR